MFNPNRTFGVELEMAGIDPYEAEALLRSADLPIKGYRTAGWECKYDGSISSRTRKGAEIASPILKGVKGLREVRKVCEILKESPAFTNASCGLHVHVGARDHSIADIAVLVRRYAALERQFDSLVWRGRRGNSNTYCKSMAPLVPAFDLLKDTVEETIETLEAKIAGCSHPNSYYYTCGRSVPYRGQNLGPVYMDAVIANCRNCYRSVRLLESLKWGHPTSGQLSTILYDRYYKLNPCALSNHGTVEFRQCNGTINPDTVTNWIRLCVNFVDVTKKRAFSKENDSLLVGMTRDSTKFLERRAALPARTTFNNWI